jgi:septal ring factor EnvC (AmiA/AmiB activator)
MADLTTGSAQAKPQGRSRLTNGSRFLPTADGRGVWERLARDTLRSLTTHCGGSEMLSETRRLAARRVSILEAELVHLEDGFAKIRAAGGEPDDSKLALYGQLADRQRRLSETLGWDRTMRDATPPTQTLNAVEELIERMRRIAARVEAP